MKSSETKATEPFQHDFSGIDDKTLRTNDRIDVCPECGNKNIIMDKDSGEYVCGRCGIIVGEIFDRGREWRTFNLDEYRRRSRTGPEITNLIPDKGLSSVIGRTNKDYYGKYLTLEQQRKIKRLKNLDNKIKISKNRNLPIALDKINEVCTKAHLPKIVAEEASVIYRKCLEKGLQRGRTIEDLAISSVYYAIRINPHVHMSKEELEEISKIDKKTIARNYRLISKNLRMKPPVQTVRDVLPRIFGKLENDLGPYTRKTTEIIARYLDTEFDIKKIVFGKKSSSIASAIIYISNQLMNNLDDPITQSCIASASHVTEVTLRNRYSELISSLGWKKEDLFYMKDIISTISSSMYNEQEKMCAHEDIIKELSKKFHNIEVEEIEDYINKLCSLSIINKIESDGRSFYKLNSELSLFL